MYTLIQRNLLEVPDTQSISQVMRKEIARKKMKTVNGVLTIIASIHGAF